MRHDLLLTTDRPTLTTLFRANGYRVFGFYPALRWEWPERAFYGFDEFIDSGALGYRGPPLGYWNIPDQYSLARFEQLHPRRDDAPPRFVFFPTITCHFPFSPVPPYQPDWQRVLTDQPYAPADVERALAERVDWLNMFPDYLRMVEYTYRWLGGFLRQREPREAVFVLLGDHQPTANISGEGASWDVPVHIVSRDAALLQRFAEQGFHAGLDPPRQPLGGMSDLTGMLLRAFAQPVAVAGAW
jgi:phosphoglycerol transferase MdoB-like AlkP superfamily enzyme